MYNNYDIENQLTVSTKLYYTSVSYLTIKLDTFFVQCMEAPHNQNISWCSRER